MFYPCLQRKNVDECLLYKEKNVDEGLIYKRKNLDECLCVLMSACVLGQSVTMGTLWCVASYQDSSQPARPVVFWTSTNTPRHTGMLPTLTVGSRHLGFTDSGIKYGTLVVYL